MMANAKAAVGLGAANIFLSGTMGLLATAGSVLMVTFSVLMPVIAIATAAIGAIAYAYEKLKAMYTTEKEKAYESAIEDLTAVQEEQVKMTRELNIAFEGNSSMLPTLTSKYTALNNILTDFGRNFSKALDAADASNTKELAKSLDTQIKGNTVLRDRFKEVYGENTTLNQVLDKYDNKLQGIKDVNKEVLLVEQNRARQIVVLSKAISEANKVATDFMNSLDNKTPYDEIVNSLEDIGKAAEGQQEKIAQIFAENATTGLIKLVNVESETKNIRTLLDENKKINDKIAKEEARLQTELQEIRDTYAGKDRRERIAAAKRDSALVVDAQRSALESNQNAVESYNETIAKGIKTRMRQTKMVQFQLKLEDAIQKKTKAQLESLRIMAPLSMARAKEENRLQIEQVKGARQAILAEGVQLGFQKENLESRLAANKAARDALKPGEDSKELTLQQLALEAEMALFLEQERSINERLNKNTQERLALEDTGVAFAKTRVEIIRHEQKFSKAVLDIQKKAASLEDRALKVALEKARIAQRERNAIDSTRLGAALTASDETKIKLDNEKRITDAIRAQGDLKKKAVDLEFTLLEAQMKLLRQEAILFNKKATAAGPPLPGQLIDLTDLDAEIAGLDTLRTKTKNVIDDEVETQIDAATRGVNAATQAAQATIEAKERSMKRLDIEQSITDEVEKQSNELSNQASVRLDIEKLENRTKGGAVKSQIRELAIAIKRKNLEVVIAKQRLAALIASQAIEGEIAAEVMYEAIRIRQMEKRVEIGSFHIESLYAMRNLSKGSIATSGAESEIQKCILLPMLQLDRWWLDPGPASVLQIPMEWDGINLATKGIVDRAHQHGQAVQFWTINERESMDHLIEIGADGIMTDDPILLREAVLEAGFELPEPWEYTES